MSDDEELPPSKLGTKEHWDMVYERENRVFNDIGDEGEVWFGEDSVHKMRAWAHDNLPSTSDKPLRILECGSGNGTLLLSFLTTPDPDTEPQQYHLTGIDYSEGAVKLGESVEKARRVAIEEGDEDVIDIDDVVNECTCEWRVGDLLRDEYSETWDLVMDKGTFDALALSDEAIAEKGGRLPSHVYPEQVAKLVTPGGFFLITSCNFTEEEVIKRYTKPGVGLSFHSSVPHKSFSFGGKKGQTVCTVAFTRDEPVANGNGGAVANGNGHATPAAKPVQPDDPLFLCVDAGGTKTDVCVLSKSGKSGRAIGSTGNMTEVGRQRAFEVIAGTILSALTAIGINTPLGLNAPCPVVFEEAWIGVSGCDTPQDQQVMTDLLRPFFGGDVKVHNDALLLGGGLLKHNVPWGVAVIAGTGSIAVGVEVDAQGEVVQAARRGGYGYLLGDDGSAYDVSRCAIRAAVDAFDAGEPEGPLSANISKHFGIKSVNGALSEVHKLNLNADPIQATNEQKLRISDLAPAVLECYTSSPPDPVAITAVRAACRPLADSIVQLVRQLLARPLPDGSQRSLQNAVFTCCGGVVRQEAYRRCLLDMVKEEGIEFGAIEPVSDVARSGAEGLVARSTRQ